MLRDRAALTKSKKGEFQMSKINDFYSAVLADSEKNAELGKILDGSDIAQAADEQLERIGEIAKQMGFDITVEEAKAYLRGDDTELDDDDLDAVAGGKGNSSRISLYRGDTLKFECNGSNGGGVTQS